MCHTRTLTHTVCQHTDTYTSQCLTQRSPPWLACFFFYKCNPTTESRALYGLCHECRRYWAARQVGEDKVTRMYMNCRRVLEWEGPLEAERFVVGDVEEDDDDDGGKKKKKKKKKRRAVRASAGGVGGSMEGTEMQVGGSDAGSEETLWPGGSWEWEGKRDGNRDGRRVRVRKRVRGRSRRRRGSRTSRAERVEERGLDG